jgi:hypothetical protein
VARSPFSPHDVDLFADTIDAPAHSPAPLSDQIRTMFGPTEDEGPLDPDRVTAEHRFDVDLTAPPPDQADHGGQAPVEGPVISGGGRMTRLLPMVDRGLPFRSQQQDPLPTAPSGRLVDWVDWLLAGLLNRRRSLGGLLAFLALAAMAAAVALVLARDLRTGEDERPTRVTSTTVQRSSSTAPIATPSPPRLVEPPSTHENTTTPERSPTTAAVAGTDPAGPATALSSTDGTTAGLPGGSTIPIGVDATDEPAGVVSSDVTAAPTTEPSLIEEASVSRIRPTSATVGFSSTTCVTASFSWAAAGGAPQVVDGRTCSSSHTLLLGRVTSPLIPGTPYSVTITAIDRSGHTSTKTVSFTTLG